MPIANIEARRAYDRERYGKRQEQKRATMRAYYWRTRDLESRRLADRSNLKNKERYREKNARRYAIQKGSTAERVDYSLVMERDNWTCYLCDEPINRLVSFPHPRSKSCDHVVPISKGGSHTYENIRAAHLTCNISKGAR